MLPEISIAFYYITDKSAAEALRRFRHLSVVLLSCNVRSMESMVSLVATVTALEVVLVNFLENGVKVRLTHSHSLVLSVESLSSFRLEVYGITYVLRLDRLTAAVYTAAGTTHDLNEGPVCFAACDLIHNKLCVSCTACNSNLDLKTCDVVGSFLKSLGTSYLVELDRIVILAGENVVSGSESRLHNTAGSAEDNCRTGVYTKRIVKLFVGKRSELKTGSLDHAGKLTGGESNVNVCDAFACCGHIISLYLKLLSGTGHNGYYKDILGVVAHLVCPVGLDERAAHLLRRLAGGEVTDELGVVVLAELDPSGRAGGDHRKGAAVLYSVKKLGSLFNDGKVCCGVGVKYLFKADSAQSRNHLALYVSADRHTEALTESCTDRRSGLHYNVLGRIGESIPYLVGIVLLNESAGRTYSGTLTAGDTGSRAEIHVEGLTDAGVDTTVVSTDYGYVLLVTNSYTSTAENTLVVISYEVGGRIVKLIGGLEAVECVLINTVLTAELLELAVGASYAGKTAHIVGGEDELKSGLTSRSYLCGIGLDLHTLGYGVYTRGNKSASAGSFNYTDTACADLILFFHIAEGRDLYTCCARSLENGCALGYAYSNTVNFTIKHFHFCVLLSLYLGNCAELTACYTSAALDTLASIDSEGRKLMSGSNVVGLLDSVNGAVSCALATSDTLILVDVEGKEVLTYACRTLLVYNVSDILVAEEVEGSKNGVGSSLSKTAERVSLDVVAEIFESVNVLESAVTVSDLVEKLKKTLGTYTAGSTLTAGLINGELKEELSHVNHTGVLIHYDKTARAHHTADGNKVVIVYLGIDKGSRDTSAGGTAGLCSLELLAVGNTAADVVDDLAKGSTHGDLNKTGVLDLTAEREYLSTLGSLSTHRGEPLYAVKDDLRNVCKGLNVVFNGRTVVKTLNCRIRRTGTGLASVTLDRGHERGFLTAYECACAESDLKIKVEAGAEYVLTEKAVFISLVDSMLKSGNCDRILCTYVYVTLSSADSVTADCHSLDYRVGVTLKNGTVHKCSGVTLVRITYNVLLICLVGSSESPFSTGGEASASSAAKTGIGNYLDNVLGSHLCKHLTESLITVHSNVFLDIVGVNNTAVTKNYTLLGLIESGIVKRYACLFYDLLSAGVCVNKTLNNTTLEKMLFNDLLYVLGLNSAVKCSVGIYDNYGTESAKTEATGLYKLNLVFKTEGCDVFLECFLDFITA